jgi:hypothetical protein
MVIELFLIFQDIPDLSKMKVILEVQKNFIICKLVNCNCCNITFTYGYHYIIFIVH